MKNVLLTLFLFMTALSMTFAQSKASVTLTFPEGLKSEHLQLKFDNGTKATNIAVAPTQKEVLIEENLDAVYGLLEIQYKEGSQNQGTRRRFLVKGDQSSSITVLPSSAPLNQFELKHAIDLEENGGKAFEAFMATPIQNLQSFFKENSEKINAGDPATAKAFDQKLAELNEKRLAFIQKNPKQYHSFLVFKDFLLTSKMDGDRLIAFYEKTFSKKIQKSKQGQNVAKYLAGKALKPGDQAPLFTATDIKNQKIQLGEFKGKKHVLVFFWATWCKFCMAEIPEIKKIRDTYSEDVLEIIAVSRDFDAQALKAGIEKHQMNWRHLYNQPQVASLFAIPEVPSFILIDKNGKILMKEQGLQLERISELKTRLAKEI